MSTGTAEAIGYRAVTEGCGVLDRSARGKLELTGAQAQEFLQGQVTNDVLGLAPGEGLYAAFLTPKGKMQGDLRVLATGDGLLLDTERVALQSLFNLIRRFAIGYDVELHKRTVEEGLLSLLGPAAARIAGVPDLAGASEHTHRPITVGGVAARAIRTDLGIDLRCAAPDLDALHEQLRAAGASDIDEATAEIRRIESGRPRFGVDLDESVIPQEAGLNDRAVSFTKGCYVGQETVARLYYRGKPNRHLRGLRITGEAAAGDELSTGGRSVGAVTSVADSPRFGRIGLGFVRREVEPGSDVDVAGRAQAARVVALPFG